MLPYQRRIIIICPKESNSPSFGANKTHCIWSWVRGVDSAIHSSALQGDFLYTITERCESCALDRRRRTERSKKDKPARPGRVDKSRDLPLAVIKRLEILHPADSSHSTCILPVASPFTDAYISLESTTKISRSISKENKLEWEKCVSAALALKYRCVYSIHLHEMDFLGRLRRISLALHAHVRCFFSS